MSLIHRRSEEVRMLGGVLWLVSEGSQQSEGLELGPEGWERLGFCGRKGSLDNILGCGSLVWVGPFLKVQGDQ